MTMKSRVIALILLVWFISSCNSSDEPSTKNQITGVFVDDKGNTIEGADICIIPIIRKTSTPGIVQPINGKFEVAELTAFSYKIINGNVQLLWATSSEMNLDKFVLMRAEINDSNTSEFVTIGSVKASGNSIILKIYSFIDSSVVNKKSYAYKLRLKDFDGNTEDSDLLICQISYIDSYLQSAVPNPFLNRTTLFYYLSKASHIKFSIKEKATGIEQKSFSLYQESGYNSFDWLPFVDINDPESLVFRPGIYTASFQTSDTLFTTDLILDFRFNEINCKIPQSTTTTNSSGKFQIDWNRLPSETLHDVVSEDGSKVGEIIHGGKSEIIARKLIVNLGSVKHYWIARDTITYDSNKSVDIRLVGRKVSVLF